VHLSWGKQVQSAAISRGGILELGKRFPGFAVCGTKGKQPRWKTSPATKEPAMAWIDDEVARWEPGESGLSAGRTFYWLATIVAAVMVIFAVADFFINWAQGAPIVRVFALIAAVAVWLIGRACRALLP
jgi:hypothetical protein